MATALEFTDTSDVTVTSLIFASVAPGSPSAWQDLRLWNDRLSAGADDSRAPRISAMAKPRGASVPYEASGIPVLTYRAIEVDVVGSGVRSLGVAAEIVLPDISAGTFVALRVRVKAPAGFSLAAADVLLPIRDDLYEDLGNAAPTPGGIDLGQFISQLFEGGAVTQTASPSTSVTVARGAAQLEGRIRGWATADYALGSADGATATLASGEAYGSLIVATLAGPSVVKGLKVTGSPAPADFPLVPAGAVALAAAVQHYGTNVTTSDITDRRTFGGFAVAATTGLGLSIGSGVGIVGTRRVRTDVRTLRTGTASATDAVLFLDESGQVVETTGAAPMFAEPLARYSSSGSAITSLVDLRRVAGPWRHASASLPGASTGEKEMIALSVAGCEICPIRGVVISIGDPIATLANTSGSWTVAIEALIAGTWVSLYPNGSPTIAFDATLSWIAPTAQLLHFEATMIRARVTALPAGGTLAPIGVSILYRPAYAG